LNGRSESLAGHAPEDHRLFDVAKVTKPGNRTLASAARFTARPNDASDQKAGVIPNEAGFQAE
jgi:hypothetical protein